LDEEAKEMGLPRIKIKVADKVLLAQES